MSFYDQNSRDDLIAKARQAKMVWDDTDNLQSLVPGTSNNISNDNNNKNDNNNSNFRNGKRQIQIKEMLTAETKQLLDSTLSILSKKVKYIYLVK